MGTSRHKMKIFSVLVFASAVSAQLDFDSLGLKKPNKGQNSAPVDKGPRECNGHKLEDSADKSKLWKCTSRNPDNKNPHLTKRCKLKCKKGKSRSGNHKVLQVRTRMGPTQGREESNAWYLYQVKTVFL